MTPTLFEPPVCEVWQYGMQHKTCGGKLKVVSYLHNQVAIHKVLDHLDLRPPEEPKPPPEAREVACVPVDDEGCEIAGNPWARAAIARRPPSATTP